MADALEPLSTIALEELEELLAIRFKVFVFEETPLKRASAMNALRGLDKFNKSLAVLFRLLLDDVDDVDCGFRNAGD